MNATTLLAAAASLPLLASSALAAETATFTSLGTGAAVDVTPDGQAVLINNAGAFVWTDGGIVPVPGAHEAVALSDDGSIILGEMIDPTTGRNAAGLWTSSTGWVSLGGLPGQTGCDLNLSNPYGLSGDGAIAVGLGWEGCDGRAFRWTAETALVALPQLGPNSARANTISADGSGIGGWDEHSTGPRRAAIWLSDGTEVLPLEGMPGNPEGIGEIWGFTTDGMIAVGQAHADASTGGGFRFMAGEVDVIAPLPGTDPLFLTVAGYAVSDDGSVVAGTNISGFGPFAAQDAIIWTAESGTEKLQDVLVAAGAEIPGSMVLASVLAMTPDGRTFVGYAKEGPFALSAFIATLPAPCPEDFDGDGSVGFTDLLRVLTLWGPCADCPEDLDGDGTVGFTDLLQVLTAWGGC